LRQKADEIRDMIEPQLFTNPGERVNRPNFECNTAEMVFAPNSFRLPRQVPDPTNKNNASSFIRDDVSIGWLFSQSESVYHATRILPASRSGAARGNLPWHIHPPNQPNR